MGRRRILILLPHTNLDGAIVVAEKLETTISSQPITKENLIVTLVLVFQMKMMMKNTLLIKK